MSKKQTILMIIGCVLCLGGAALIINYMTNMIDPGLVQNNEILLVLGLCSGISGIIIIIIAIFLSLHE